MSLNTLKEVALQAAIFIEYGCIVLHSKAATCKMASMRTENSLNHSEKNDFH